MSSALSPLAASLIAAGSALAGGVISTGGQMGIEWSRGRRERKRDDAASTRQLRLAVRLVIEELAEAKSLIEEAATSRRYWVAPRALPTETWSLYRTDIAAAIESAIDWRLITAAYDAINNMNWTVQHRRITDQAIDVPVRGAWVRADENTRAVWRAVREAIGSLERTIGVMGPASRMLREREEQEARLWPFGDGDDFDEEAAMSAEAMERNSQGY